MHRSRRYQTHNARRDTVHDVPFPGLPVARDRWTRTRVGLGELGTPFDWDGVFGRRAPRVVDLGCGNGRFLALSALARPTHDHLGIDLVPPSIRFASLRTGQRGLTNVRFAWGDASEFILQRAAPNSVDEVHLYHPQPYREAGKVERRQLTPEILLAIWGALAPGGLLVFQSDNPGYQRYAQQVIPQLFEWREHSGPWPDAPEGRTLREIVARDQGLKILRAQAVRLELAEPEARRRASAMPAARFDAGPPRRGRRIEY